MQLRKSQRCRNKTAKDRKSLGFFFKCIYLLYCAYKKTESLSDATPIKTKEGRMRAEPIEQEVKDCSGEVLQHNQLSLLPQVT